MINIVFTHPDFLVIDKPAGLNFHSEDGEAGCIALLSEQLTSLTLSQSLYPVHRLDKMTSGLLLVALNKSAAQQFQVMFSQREINKYYLAVSDQKPKKKQGWVKGDMLNARNGSWKLSKTQENPRKPKKTLQSPNFYRFHYNLKSVFFCLSLTVVKRIN